MDGIEQSEEEQKKQECGEPERDTVIIEEELVLTEETSQELTGPTLLLDSSFVLALLNPEDPNHKTVKGIFGFVEPYNCRYHIPLYVFAEVLSKIVHQEKRVSIATKTLDTFVKNLNGVLYTGVNPSFEDIVKRYKDLARKKTVLLQSNDFIIVTEGMLSESIMLTCDYEMHNKVKGYYSNIYYVATDSTKYDNDVAKFVQRFLKNIGKK